MTGGGRHAHLRAAIELSRAARAKGNEPYGALLVDAGGTVLLGGENTQVTDRDCTGHAELNLMRAASRRFDAATLAGCTVYASGEPCPMCAGAIYWGGVGRVVYALERREHDRARRPRRRRDPRVLPRRARPGHARAIEVLGPALEDEARRVFES